MSMCASSCFHDAKRRRGMLVTRHLLADPLTLHIAAVGTAWSLLGSPRNGQAALYLFQKIFTVLRVHL